MKPDSRVLKPAVVLFVLILAAYAAIRGLEPPPISKGAVPEGEFSVPRALDDIRAVSRRPHPLGSDAHDEVFDIIVGKWKEMGIEPGIQTATVAFGKGEAARVRNILARLRGTSPGKALMLAGHYDSVTLSPGAADDGSSVGILLETARVLKSGPPLKHDIIFLITDGEEDALLGARAFAKEHPWAAEAGLVLNFEARGTSGPGVMFQTSRGNSALVGEFLKAAPRPQANSFAATIYGLMPNDTDMTEFMKAGIQGLNFAFIGTPQDYHTPMDNMDNLDPRSLAHQGSYALSLARHFGANGIPGPSSSDLVYFNLVGSIVVRYSRTIAFVLIAAAALLLAAAGIRGFSGKLLTVKKLVIAFLLLIAGIALTAVLSVLFMKLAAHAHGRWLPSADTANSLPYFLAIAALGAAAVLILFRPRTGWPNFAFAAAFIGLLLNAGTVMKFPGTSYLFGISVLFLAAALIPLFRAGKDGHDSWAKTGIAALAAVPAILVFVPLLSLFFTAMGLNVIGAAGLGIFLALMLGLIAPALEIVMRSGRKAWILLAVLAFIGFAAAGAATTRFTDRHPRPIELGYRLDLDSGKADWFVWTGIRDEWTSGIIGAPKPGFKLADPAYERYAFTSGDAPAADYAPPAVTVLEETTIGTGRALKVRIGSPRKPWKLTAVSGDAAAASAPIDGGGAVNAAATPRGVRLRFTNPGPDGFTMILENCRPGPISVEVEEWLLGLPELGDRRVPDPPSNIMPVRLFTVLHKTYMF